MFFMMYNEKAFYDGAGDCLWAVCLYLGVP